MRRSLALVCHALAWLALATALPGIWVTGFLRGVALALLHPEPGCRYPRAVLTETDAATILGAHERAIRSGEAKWQ